MRNRTLPVGPMLALLTLLHGTAGYTQTLTRIQQTGHINLGYLADQPPFSFESADQKPAGYAIELCSAVVAAIKHTLQFPDLAVAYIRVTRATGLERVERGEVDLLCSAVPETLQARARVSFSIPIYAGGIGVAVRSDAPPALLRVLNGQVAHTGPNWRATINGGLENHTYAVFAGAASETWVRERITGLGVIAKVVPVSTYGAGIEMLDRGEASAFFADRAVLTSAIAQRAASDLKVLDRRFTLEPAALVLMRGDENFRLAVDSALSRLYRSGDIVPIYSRGFGAPTETARMLFQVYALP